MSYQFLSYQFRCRDLAGAWRRDRKERVSNCVRAWIYRLRKNCSCVKPCIRARVYRLRKNLYGREDVSGHDLSRAAKLLKNNISLLPQACAQPGELFVSAIPREPRARAKPSDEKRSAQNKRFFAASFSRAV